MADVAPGDSVVRACEAHTLSPAAETDASRAEVRCGANGATHAACVSSTTILAAVQSASLLTTGGLRRGRRRARRGGGWHAFARQEDQRPHAQQNRADDHEHQVAERANV